MLHQMNLTRHIKYRAEARIDIVVRFAFDYMAKYFVQGEVDFVTARTLT